MIPIYDAIVIGAGPAGSLCAYKLSKQGLRVLIIEAQEKIKRKVCGEYLSPSGVSLLIEEGLKEKVVDQFLPILGMKIVPAGGAPLPTDFPMKQGIALNRQKFDEILLQLAKDDGAEVRLGTRLTQLSKGPSGWKIKINDDEELCARLIIGADGRNSFTAKALGLKNQVDTSRVALHCHIPTTDKNLRYGEMHLFKDGSYLGIDPTGDHEINISLCCESTKLKGSNLHELLNSYIKQSSEIMKFYGEVPKDIKINTVTPITNKMTKIIQSNAALIGDAAGFLDPLTGEGMFNALWMAKALTDEIEQSKSISIFNYQSALEVYAKRKNSFFKHKTTLNKLFQFIIKRPRIVNLLALFLSRKKERANIFVGIIGNIYRPLEGIYKLLTV